MMSPHMSNRSGAVPATIDATSLFCQSSGVGITVTLPMSVAFAKSWSRVDTDAFIQASGWLTSQVRSILPLPWAVWAVSGVGVGSAWLLTGMADCAEAVGWAADCAGGVD